MNRIRAWIYRSLGIASPRGEASRAFARAGQLAAEGVASQLPPRAERCPEADCTDESQCWRCDYEEFQAAGWQRSRNVVCQDLGTCLCGAQNGGETPC